MCEYSRLAAAIEGNMSAMWEEANKKRYNLKMLGRCLRLWVKGPQRSYSRACSVGTGLLLSKLLAS